MSKHLVFPQPIAHSPTKLESRSAPQRFRRRLDRWPSGGPWRIATPPAAPPATALDRGRRRRAGHRCHWPPTCDNKRVVVSKNLIPLLYRWYARTHPTLHSHHPHVKLEISFKASHARNATPISKLATGPHLVLASLAPHTWLVPRAREGALVARRRARRASRVATSRTPHVSGSVGPAEEEC